MTHTQNAPIAPTAHEAISRDLAATYVSPVSAWGIGLLSAGKRISLAMTPASWFHSFIERPGVALAERTPDILIAAWFLPGDMHRDPADRILCATARECGHTVVTRDRQILEYAAAGHVRALAR